ncbi:metallophosphoesterase [Streptomyces adustus]|uniref:Metallophosphoesterase n=1 Tax=Streptomyces adustus TaxID=1609272 RepID=A0A5N8VSJ3_9ACTN|nr:metallophosphoesterase [Streptomyces adustus]MPY36875.1 metallophosphoesterase [Streptomyces adustus]
MRILHLSDTHLERTDEPNRHGVDATGSLRLMLAELAGQRDIDAVVVTGDLANDGAVEAYATVRETVGAFARTWDAPVFFTTGNHDERQAFAKVLGSGHLGPDGTDRAAAVLPGPERAAVGEVAGHRFVTLDSLVPGEVYGRLGETQLAWLREVLATPARHGTVLALHHPPICLDVPTQRAFGLLDADALADAIRGTDVRVVLAGHFHLQLSGFLAGVPVWVTPGVVNRIDLTTRPGTERAVRGASASLVELGGATGPMFHTFHARDPRAHETVYELDEERTREVIARYGPTPDPR